MSDPGLAAQLQQAVATMSGWEAAAVVLGIAYLLLAVRESSWCWYAAFASTGILLVLFWNVNLVMESALQVYYLAMAAYGWWQWRHGGSRGGALAISRWSWRAHLLGAGAVAAATLLSGALLHSYSNAALPFLDSFTTWGSILTTWMVARKVLENWLYWLVIDSASIVLYVDRGLYLVALLFAAYLVIIVFGYRTWLAHYRATSG